MDVQTPIATVNLDYSCPGKSGDLMLSHVIPVVGKQDKSVGYPCSRSDVLLLSTAACYGRLSLVLSGPGDG